MTLQPALDADPRIVQQATKAAFYRRLLIPVGVLSFTFLPLLGRISITEVLALVLLPVCFHGFGKSVRLRRFAMVFLILVGGLAASAYAHHSPLVAAIKAIANYGFLLLLSAFLVGLSQTDPVPSIRRLAGLSGVGQIVGLLLTPPITAAVNPWKFGLGSGLTLLILALIKAERRSALGRRGSFALLVILAGVHVVLGSRSLAMLTLVAAAVLLLNAPEQLQRGHGMKSEAVVPRVRRRPFLLPTLSGLSLAGAVKLYGILAAGGALGAKALVEFREQSGDYGLLIGARKDIVFMVFNWLKQPWIGLGPGALSDDRAQANALNWLYMHHYTISGSDYFALVFRPVLTLHSVALGAIVSAGLFALPFAIWLVVATAGGLSRALSTRDPLLVFVLLTGTTHVFVSPLGDISRFPIALALAYAVLSSRHPEASALGLSTEEGVPAFKGATAHQARARAAAALAVSYGTGPAHGNS